MIQITPQMKILLAVKAADFRKGIDGLARLCKAELKSDPFSGYVFVFQNKRANALKILIYDGQGFWLCQKRLSQGKFKWWPQSGMKNVQDLDVHELLLLIWNGDPSASKTAPFWRRVNPLPISNININRC
jgi:transposase